ncbi:MAG: IclR family transcriptional regulator C-terminal domain-containing protein [Novosphingobium sp.]
MPVHCTAIGKVCLASMSDDDLEELAEGLHGIAVPITDSRDRAVAALCASVVTSASSKRDIRAHIVPALRSTAEQLRAFA